MVLEPRGTGTYYPGCTVLSIPDSMVGAAAAPDEGQDDNVVLLALVVVHDGDGDAAGQLRIISRHQL